MLKKLIVLGTGTIVPVPGRSCAGYLLETDTDLVLIDCGPGVLHALADIHIDYSRLHHILITHFHWDHVSDLFALIISMHIRSGGKTKSHIAGPQGIKDMLYQAKKYLFQHQADYIPEQLQITELTPGSFTLNDLTVETDLTGHTDRSLCYRFTDDTGKTVFYSGDTIYNDRIVRLGKAADIAVIECSHSEQYPHPEGHMRWPDVLKFDREAQPRHLVVTHFYEDFLLDSVMEQYAEDTHITFAHDKQEFLIK